MSYSRSPAVPSLCGPSWATPTDFRASRIKGFAEATSEAVDRYTAEYSLERLDFPGLNPEYGNPLFLKLACEALTTLG